MLSCMRERTCTRAPGTHGVANSHSQTPCHDAHVAGCAAVRTQQGGGLSVIVAGCCPCCCRRSTKEATWWVWTCPLGSPLTPSWRECWTTTSSRDRCVLGGVWVLQQASHQLHTSRSSLHRQETGAALLQQLVGYGNIHFGHLPQACRVLTACVAWPHTHIHTCGRLGPHQEACLIVFITQQVVC